MLLLLNPAVDLCKVDEVHRDGFLRIPASCVAANQPFGLQQGDAFVGKASGRGSHHKGFHLPGFETGFLKQFPESRRLNCFVRMFRLITHQPRGQFDCVSAEWDAVLLNQNDLLFIGNCDNSYGSDRVGPLGEGPMSGLHQAKELCLGQHFMGEPGRIVHLSAFFGLTSYRDVWG